MLLHIQLDGHEDLIYGNLNMERIREAAELIGDVVQQYKSASDPVSATDELKKFKELLDMGAISQEEFEAKIKQLEEAKIELETYLKAQAGETSEAAAVDDNEPLD